MRMPRLRACRCRYCCSSKSSASAASRPLAGAVGPELYSARHPSWVTCQGAPNSSMAACTPSVPLGGAADHAGVDLGGQHLGEGGPDAGHRDGVTGEGAADSSDVEILPALAVPLEAVAHPLAEFAGHAPGGRGDAAADGLADDDDVGPETVARGHASGTGAEGVGLIDDQDGAGAVAGGADGVVPARLRQHDADVGHGGFDEHRRDLAGVERGFEARRRRRRRRRQWSRREVRCRCSGLDTTRPSSSRVA